MKPLEMKTRRKRYESAFRARVALQALRGVKTIQQIASEDGAHPVRVSSSKKTQQKRLAGAFERSVRTGAPKDFE
jgi:transposase